MTDVSAAVLRELAAELGVPNLTDPARISALLIQRRCEREARIRQLEDDGAALRRELAAAVIDQQACIDRSSRAERQLGLVVVVAALTIGACLFANAKPPSVAF